MTSSMKKSLKKVLKVSIIVILLFITVSTVATKLIYDSVFKRYENSLDAMHSPTVSVYVSDYTKHSYPSGENTLKGHLYRTVQNTADLVVIVPGFHAETDHFTDYVTSFCENGFNVFVFDCTGHGESGGDSAVGFPQVISDLNATLSYLENNTEFKNIYLFGHSRGGYAACCVLKDNPNIKKVVTVNGVNSAMDGIMAYSVPTVGTFAYGNYPFLWMYQVLLFGSDLTDRSAADCISESDTPVLVIQSDKDENLSDSDFSIYSHKKEIQSDTVQFLLYDTPDRNGHTSVLYDENKNANPDIVAFSVDFFKQ